MPVFPLPGLVLLPQQVIPLHIFEERYRSMVRDALDGAGQIAMGLFEGSRWKQDYHGRPPLRRAVCVGQIVHHDPLPDGRFNVLVQGVCRARIVGELPPREDRPYREAMLEPLEGGAPDEAGLEPMREWVEAQLDGGELRRLSCASELLEYVRNEDVPMNVLLELIAFTTLEGVEVRYGLLAEAELSRRAELVRSGLEKTRRLIRLADRQGADRWPKGVSWN